MASSECQSLPPEQHASYSAIIDSILASSDLNTISAKRIRKGLQEKVSYDLTPQKQVITALIMERFDKYQRELEDGTATTVAEPVPTANGTAYKSASGHDEDLFSASTSPAKRKVDDEDGEEDQLSDAVDTPPPKKAKKVKSEVETDEQIAKRMQAELNAQAGRATRGAGSKRKTVAKKQAKPKKKSQAIVGSDDDSEVGGAGKPEKEKKGGFHKPMTLSEPLAFMLGETSLSRPQTVKRIWEYIKANELQNPSDKREIRCDDTMRAIFKQDKVHMFTMNKLLASHLYAQDE